MCLIQLEEGIPTLSAISNVNQLFFMDFQPVPTAGPTIETSLQEINVTGDGCYAWASTSVGPSSAGVLESKKKTPAGHSRRS